VAVDHRIAFGSLSWESLAPAARQKVFRHGDSSLRLVEFDREFVEPDWCTRGHIGYVLEGELDVDFDGAVIRYVAGDGVFIPAGIDHRHKAKVVSDVVRLVLVEHA